MGEPWYFDTIGFTEIPDDVTGRDVVVNVVDSCIDFNNSPALAAVHISSLEDKLCTKELIKLQNELEGIGVQASKDYGRIWKEYVHGTTIASIIAAKKYTLPFSKLDGSINYYNDRGITEVTVMGVAADSKIKGSKEPINPLKVEQTIGEGKAEITSKGTEYFPKFLRSNIVLINLSGGEKVSGADKEGWVQIIQQACKDKYTLIMASVGNDGCDLNIKSSKCGVYPAFMKNPRSCQELNPVLRVSASIEYSKGAEPILYHNSNYGNKYVDILAPGQSIPSLVPNGYAMIASGTSQAAAVVSGLAAVLASCAPYADAATVRNAIIGGADQYKQLSEHVKEGRVINAVGSIETLCLSQIAKDTALSDKQPETIYKDEL